MRDGQKLLLASAIASLLAPTITAAVFASQSQSNAGWVFFSFVCAWLVTVFHLLILGIPLLIFLERKTKVNAVSITAVGFVAGCGPVGGITSPLLSVGTSNSAQWLQWLISCLPFGVLGVFTALALWRTLRALDGYFPS